MLPGLALTVVLPAFNFIGDWVLILSCAVRNPPFVTFALRIFLSRAAEIAEALCNSTRHPDIRKVWVRYNTGQLKSIPVLTCFLT